MPPDRQAALTDLFQALLDDLTVPRPLEPADDGLYALRLAEATDVARGALRHLLHGPLDNLAIHDEARVLQGLQRPVAYPAERRLAS